MDKRLQETLEAYVSNRDEIRRIYDSYGIPMHLMGATVLTAAGMKPDEERLLACQDMLRQKESMDSPIRGIIKTITAVSMSMAEDPEGYYKNIKMAYDLIRVNRGGSDERYYMAAYVMLGSVQGGPELLMMIDRAGAIHEAVGKSHNYFEDSEAYVMAAYAAAFGVTNAREYAEKVEAYVDEFEKRVGMGQISEKMCMLLALQSDRREQTVDRAMSIFEALAAKDLHFRSDEEGGSVAALTGLPLEPEKIAELVKQADDFLLECSGFVEKGPATVLRHVYAAALVCIAYAPRIKFKDRSLPDGIRNVIRSRDALMQVQMVMHIQLTYVDIEDLHI